MKIILFLLLPTIFAIGSCEPPPNRSYLPPKKNYLPPRNTYLPPSANQQISVPQKLAPGTFIIQVRSDAGRPKLVIKRGPPPGKRHLPGNVLLHRPAQPAPPGRFAKPFKFVLSPQFLFKPSVGFGHSNIRKPTRVTKFRLNSPKIPNGYVYEKPFSPVPSGPHYQVDNHIDLPQDYQFSPIHTIPAPNLGHGAGFSGNQYRFNNHFTNSHQYQVTEEQTNDQIIHDQFSGKVKYFAPDPDPSLPVRKIPPSADPYSMPSEGNSLPQDLQNQYLPPQQISRPPATSYGVPINSIPVPNLVEGMPLSVFNPSYLVSQSKNLYDQHRQQLPKPEIAAPSSHYGTEDLTQHVASDGQIVHAASDAIIPATPTPQTDLTVHPLALSPQIGTYAALVAQPQLSSAVTVSYEAHTVQPDVSQHLHLENPVAQGGFVVSNYYGAQGSDLQPYSQQLVGDASNHQQYVDIQESPQPVVTPTPQPQFIVTPSIQHPFVDQNTQQQLLANGHQQYPIQNDQQQQLFAPNHSPYYVDLSQQQLQNQHTLEEANQQLQQQLFDAGAQEYSTNQNIQQEISAFDQHQRLLEQQFGSTPFGTYAPDGSFQQPSNLHKRSDKLSDLISKNESKEGEVTVPASSEEKPKEESAQNEK